MDELGKMTWEVGLGYRLRSLADSVLHRLPAWLRERRLKFVTLEVVTECNRKCVYCPPHSSLDIPPLRMDWEVYRRIVDSLAANGFAGWLSYSLSGESLLDEKLEDRIRYAVGKSAAILPVVYTNGDLLTAQKFLALKAAGMHMLIISQHSRELGGALTETLRALKRDHPELYTVSIMDYYKLYYTDGNKLGVINNRGGLADVKRKPLSSCRELDYAAIDCLGNVLLCCQDCTSSYVFGNVLEKDFFAIWNDPVFAAARRRIERGEWLFEICRKCAGPEGLCTAKPRGKARRLPPAFGDLGAVMDKLRRGA